MRNKEKFSSNHKMLPWKERGPNSRKLYSKLRIWKSKRRTIQENNHTTCPSIRMRKINFCKAITNKSMKYHRKTFKSLFWMTVKKTKRISTLSKV